MNLKKYLLSVLYTIKSWISSSKLLLGKRLGLIQTLMIMPYKGFGNKNEVFFMGRVMRDRGVGFSTLEDTKWQNFGKMYKRFMTWEIPFVRVQATFNGFSLITQTDEEGYFKFNISSGDEYLAEPPELEIRLTLIDSILKIQNKVEALNKVLIVSGGTAYGIISDIDDTIVPTGATRFLEMIKTTFFKNAHSRIPFPGVAAFYHALAKGISGNDNNPLFYVSSSPWNLYDFLNEFMDIHGIPRGPLMLRDIGLSRDYFIAVDHTDHKLMQVERIFKVISDIPFILIGDSGQHDAEIYLQVIKDFPGRVKMVYIRDVDSRKHEKVLKTANEIKSLGVEPLLVKDTVEAARHAVTKGWIAENDLWNVAGEKAEEEAGN